MGYIARAATARQPISQQNTIGKREANSFVRSFGMLITGGLGAFMFLGEIMILFSTVMTIFALYYSLIKRTILLFWMRRKLKKGAAQNLRHNQVGGKGQNTVCAIELSPLSFKESLELSRKDYFIIFFLAFIVIVSLTGLIAFFSFLIKSAIVLHGYMVLLFTVGMFVMQLLLWFWLWIIVFLPVILILHSFLQYGVEKTMKRLETFV